jgi:6-phosphofructokinase 2
MLDNRCIERRCIEIAGETRISLTVHDRSADDEYRFVPEGPEVADSEWQACLDEARKCDCSYLIASGSLPRGVPDDFYAQLGSAVGERGARYVLDTSGAELRQALERGGIFLVKPSHGELAELIGHRVDGVEAIHEAVRPFVERGQAEYVAVTMGRKGALLVARESAHFLPALDVTVRSAVGAGDSFLAAMTYGFAQGMPATEAFRLGVAAGAAAVEAPGTELCKVADVERLLVKVPAL